MISRPVRKILANEGEEHRSIQWPEYELSQKNRVMFCVDGPPKNRFRTQPLPVLFLLCNESRKPSSQASKIIGIIGVGRGNCGTEFPDKDWIRYRSVRRNVVKAETDCCASAMLS